MYRKTGKLYMTNLLLTSIIFYTNLFAQGLIFRQDTSVFSGWKLDSTKWITHDTVFSAKVRCDHIWVYQSDSSSVGSFITEQNKPPFWQEDKSDDTWFYNNRRKICRACLTEVAEHLVKYWHYVPPPKTEFEILRDKQKSLTKVKRK